MVFIAFHQFQFVRYRSAYIVAYSFVSIDISINDVPLLCNFKCVLFKIGGQKRIIGILKIRNQLESVLHFKWTVIKIKWPFYKQESTMESVFKA